MQLGELSAARQALEGANVAPGNLAIPRALTNRDRRPPVARQERQEIFRSAPVDVRVVWRRYLVCFRTARRGAAPGPSGMTADRSKSEAVSWLRGLRRSTAFDWDS